MGRIKVHMQKNSRDLFRGVTGAQQLYDAFPKPSTLSQLSGTSRRMR